MGEEERSNKHLGNVHYPSNTTGSWRGYESTVCWLDLCVAYPATAAKGATTARRHHGLRKLNVWDSGITAGGKQN